MLAKSIQGGLMWSKDQTGSLLIIHRRVEITKTPEVSSLPAFNDSLLKIHTWSAQTDTCSLCVSWQQRQERLCVEWGKKSLPWGRLAQRFWKQRFNNSNFVCLLSVRCFCFTSNRCWLEALVLCRHQSGSPRCGHPDKTFLVSEVIQTLKSPAQCGGLEHWAAVSRRQASLLREMVFVQVCDKIVNPKDWKQELVDLGWKCLPGKTGNPVSLW